MTTKEVVYFALLYLIIGMIVGSVIEKYFDNEPYFVIETMAQDTVYVDTLYIDSFNAWNDTINGWEPVNSAKGYMYFEFDGDREYSDTIRVNIKYY